MHRGVRVALVAAVGTSASPQGPHVVVLCEDAPGDASQKQRKSSFSV